MKTHNFSISLFSVLCVLCAGITTDALSATVKTLGGTGTINGTAAASSATRVAPTRAGSLRVTPSSARVVTANNNSGANTSGSAATTTTIGNQRLSIGKYLGGATTTAVASTSPEMAGLPEEIQDISGRLDSLETVVGPSSATGGKDLSDRVAELEKNQPTYSANGIVVVENGEVSIDMGELKKEFFGTNDNIAMEYDDQSGSIKWGIADDNGDVAEWFTLVDTNTLSGDYASTDDLETAIDNLADVYLKKNDAQSIYQTIANLTQTIDENSTATQYPSAKAVYDALAGVSGSTLDIAEQINDKIGDIGTGVTVEQALATKQDVIDGEHKLPASNVSGLSAVATGGSYNDLTDKPDLKTVATTGSYNDLTDKPVLADVATGGEFMDLDDVKTATNLEYIEVGEVEGNDGAAWIWGYVNGEPTFIRVVGKNGQ